MRATKAQGNWRGGGKSIPPELVERIKELHASGLCDPSIAKALSINSATVNRWRKRLGLSANKPHQNYEELSLEEEGRRKAVYDLHLGNLESSQRLGITVGAFTTWCRSRGLEGWGRRVRSERQRKIRLDKKVEDHLRRQKMREEDDKRLKELLETREIPANLPPKVLVKKPKREVITLEGPPEIVIKTVKKKVLKIVEVEGLRIKHVKVAPEAAKVEESLAEAKRLSGLSPQNVIEEGSVFAKLQEMGYATRRIGKEINRSGVYVQDRITIVKKLKPELLPLVGTKELPVSLAHRLAECSPIEQTEWFDQYSKNGLRILTVDRYMRHPELVERCDCRACPIHGKVLEGWRINKTKNLYFVGTWSLVHRNSYGKKCFFCERTFVTDDFSFPLKATALLTSQLSCENCMRQRAESEFVELFDAMKKIPIDKLPVPQKGMKLGTWKHKIHCPTCGYSRFVQRAETRRESHSIIRRYVCTNCNRRFAISYRTYGEILKVEERSIAGD